MTADEIEASERVISAQELTDTWIGEDNEHCPPHKSRRAIAVEVERRVRAEYELKVGDRVEHIITNRIGTVGAYGHSVDMDHGPVWQMSENRWRRIDPVPSAPKRSVRAEYACELKAGDRVEHTETHAVGTILSVATTAHVRWDNRDPKWNTLAKDLRRIDPAAAEPDPVPSAPKRSAKQLLADLIADWQERYGMEP